jgi:predicted amidohydrolase YtcJ
MLSDIVGFINGKIYVSFNPVRRASGLVVSRGKILYVGTSGKAKDLANALDGKVVDLGGSTVMPGFVDAHMHLDSLGFSLSSLNLRNTQSIKELNNLLKKFYDEHKSSSWIIGRGWDQELFREKRWPTRWDIDEVVPDVPVMLTRVCGHAAVVNTKALEIIDLPQNILESSYFHKNEKGLPTGVVLEGAVELFRSKIKFSMKEIEKMLSQALAYATSLGVTTVGFMSCNLATFASLQSLRLRRTLPVRVRTYMSEGLDLISTLGIGRSFGDEYLKIMGIKLFVDGSLGARTALLSKPYNDDASTLGTLVTEKQNLVSTVRKAHENKLQVAIHAIGDAAVDVALEAYSTLGSNLEKYRHRIEHASIVRPEQVKKMAKLGVCVSVQPHFTISDWWIESRVGKERVLWAYPFRSMIKSKVKVGFSTDSPVEPLNPWETVYAAVTRGEDTDFSNYSSKEKLSLKEALFCYTIGSAYLLFEEKNVGSLEEGKYADFIVINKDPFEVDLEELKNMKTLMTVVAGKIMYKSPKLKDIASF